MPDNKNFASASVPQSTEIEDPIIAVIEAMRAVKTDTPEAELNSISISDGKGGRVLL